MRHCVFCITLLVAVFSASSTLAEGFTLTSASLSGQITDRQVFNGFGCSGENISPQLAWKNAPAATKSFAVTVYDPDAPTGAGWWHWLVFDIAESVRSLPENAGNMALESPLTSPATIQSTTSFGTPGFGGACPPEGDAAHRYVFTVYALGIESLGLKGDATPALVGYYLQANALARASIMAYYAR
jgi:Raf kinase inhibitor-like YbhB/YbcL family protein